MSLAKMAVTTVIAETAFLARIVKLPSTIVNKIKWSVTMEVYAAVYLRLPQPCVLVPLGLVESTVTTLKTHVKGLSHLALMDNA